MSAYRGPAWNWARAEPPSWGDCGVGEPGWWHPSNKLPELDEPMPWVPLVSLSPPLLSSSQQPICHQISHLLSHSLVTQLPHSQLYQGSPTLDPGFQGPMASVSTCLPNCCSSKTSPPPGGQVTQELSAFPAVLPPWGPLLPWDLSVPPSLAGRYSI